MGCKKGTDRENIPLSAADLENWVCPFDEPECKESLQAISWFRVHRTKLLAGGVALIALLLVVVVSSGAGKRKLEADVKKLRTEVGAWRKEVSRAPADRGLGDPAVRLWVERYKRRQDDMKKLPRDPQSLPLLAEDSKQLSEGIKRAAKIVVPKPEGHRSLQVYRDLTQQGVSHGGVQKSLASRAAREGIHAHDQVLSMLQKQVQSGIAELRAKSTPPSDVEKLPDGATVKESYIAALEGALARITKAIQDEKDRRERERLAELERQRRAAAVEAQMLEEEREREWNAAEVVIKVTCEDALRESLVASLARDYVRRKQNGGEPRILERNGVRKFVWRDGALSLAVALTGDHGPSPDPPSSSVVVNMTENTPARMKAHIIALDAMVAVVPSTRSLRELSAGDLHKVLSGEVRNWRQLGGEDQELQLVVPSAGSEDALVVTPEFRGLHETNSRVRSPGPGQSVGEAVQALPGGLGLASFHAAAEFKMLSLAPTAGASGILPRPLTISTEDYLYCRRVFAHTTSSPTTAVVEFLNYLRSAEGQQIVAQANYVDLRIQLVATPLPPEAMVIIGRVLGTDKVVQAHRLSTSFRFALDSERLDLKALADVDRVQKILSRATIGNVRCLVVGFADSQGTAEYNQGLSKDRADAVSSRIETSSGELPRLVRVALGEMLPVADNDSESGREKNRRVELWLVETI